MKVLSGTRECPGCDREFPVNTIMEKEAYIEHLKGHLGE